MNRTQCRLISMKQRRVARENRAWLRAWIYGPDSPCSGRAARSEYYRSMVETDVRPLERIADLFVTGDLAGAKKVAWAMDTAPRELIVEEIWRLL